MYETALLSMGFVLGGFGFGKVAIEVLKGVCYVPPGVVDPQPHHFCKQVSD